MKIKKHKLIYITISVVSILIILGLYCKPNFSSLIKGNIKQDNSDKLAVTTSTPFATTTSTSKPVSKTTMVTAKTNTQTSKLPTLNGSSIFSLINNYRSASGKPFLSVSSELCNLAEQRADYMMANNMEAFKSSGTGGHTGLSSMTNQYSGGMIGENLGANLSSNSAVLNIWKNSAPHNELMLVTEKGGFQMTKGCVATRVSTVGSIVVLLIGDK